MHKQIGSGDSVRDRVFQCLWFMRGRWYSNFTLAHMARTIALSTFISEVRQALDNPASKYRRWRVESRCVSRQYGFWEYRIALRRKVK